MTNTRDQNERELKKAAMLQFQDYVGKGKYVSVPTAAKYLDMTERSVFRWLSLENLFFITLTDLERLTRFFQKVHSVVDGWTKIVTGWNPDKRKITIAVTRDFYNEKCLKILNNPNLTPDKKITKLTRQTLRRWAQEGKTK